MEHADSQLLSVLCGTAGSEDAKDCVTNCSSRFLRAVARHLLDPSSSQLYDSSAAFEAFIGGGGNVGVYAEATAKLRECIESVLVSRSGSLSLLDLGAGTGKLLLPLLSALLPLLRDVASISIVLMDASAPMLAGLEEKIMGLIPHAHVSTFVGTFSEFVAQDEGEFDFCISSFALHYTQISERIPILKWIFQSCQRFYLVEFDVDDEILHGRSWDDVERFCTLARKFEAGLGEYQGTPHEELVLAGFLAPVFCFNFQPRVSSWETASVNWMKQLTMAGYDSSLIHRWEVAHYWWAPCFVLESRSTFLFDKQPIVSPLMEIHNYGAPKGRGYRAVSAIPAGTLLLKEHPLVIEDLSQDEARYHVLGSIVQRGIASSSEEAYQYLMNNAFRVGSETHLFHRKSIFNHSCWCNAAQIADDQVIALRDIREGEELCISYIGGVLHSLRTCYLFLPNEFRAAHLRNIFGFQCLCNRCVGTEAQEIEALLVSLGVTQDLWQDLPADFVERTNKEWRAEFLEKVEKHIEKHQSVLSAAPYLSAAAAITLDVKWLNHAREAFEKLMPQNFPQTQSIESLIRFTTERKRGISLSGSQ